MAKRKRPDVVDLTQESDEEQPTQAWGTGRRVTSQSRASTGTGAGRRRRASKQSAEEEGEEHEQHAHGEHAASQHRQRAKKQKEKEEKRQDAAGVTVRWASKPSIRVQERIDRALAVGAGAAHRMYLLDRQVLTPPGSGDAAAEEFTVQGATGNVYTVTICRQPQCTCPDFLKRGSCCKHILFALLRVLGLDRRDPLVWQRAYLSKEVDDILAGLRGRPAGAPPLASVAAREQYRRLSGAGGEAGGGAQQRAVEDGDDCPICYEPLGTEPLTFCKDGCGGNFHRACIKLWLDNKRASAQAPTCPLCRAAWQQDGSGGGGEPKYINVGGSSQGPSLDALYGNRSVWVRANMGQLGRGEAAAMWNAMGH